MCSFRIQDKFYSWKTPKCQKSSHGKWNKSWKVPCGEAEISLFLQHKMQPLYMPKKEDFQVFKSKQLRRILFQRRKNAYFLNHWQIITININSINHWQGQQNRKEKKNCLKVFESISKQGDSGGELTPEIKIKEWL